MSWIKDRTTALHVRLSSVATFHPSPFDDEPAPPAHPPTSFRPTNRRARAATTAPATTTSTFWHKATSAVEPPQRESPPSDGRTPVKLGPVGDNYAGSPEMNGEQSPLSAEDAGGRAPSSERGESESTAAAKYAIRWPLPRLVHRDLADDILAKLADSESQVKELHSRLVLAASAYEDLQHEIFVSKHREETVKVSLRVYHKMSVGFEADLKKVKKREDTLKVQLSAADEEIARLKATVTRSKAVIEQISIGLVDSERSVEILELELKFAVAGAARHEGLEVELGAAKERIGMLERDLEAFSEDNWEGEDGLEMARDVLAVDEQLRGPALVDAFDSAMNGLSSTTSPSILRAAFLVLARQQLLAPPPPAVPSPSPSPTPAPHLPWPQPALDALFSLQAKLIEARRELHEARSESTSTVAEPDGAPCHSAIMERAWKFKITKLEGELAAAKATISCLPLSELVGPHSQASKTTTSKRAKQRALG